MLSQLVSGAYFDMHALHKMAQKDFRMSSLKKIWAGAYIDAFLLFAHIYTSKDDMCLCRKARQTLFILQTAIKSGTTLDITWAVHQFLPLATPLRESASDAALTGVDLSPF